MNKLHKQIAIDVLDGMSFAEAGRENNRTTETVSRVFRYCLRRVKFALEQNGVVCDFKGRYAEFIYSNRALLRPFILTTIDLNIQRTNPKYHNKSTPPARV